MPADGKALNKGVRVQLAARFPTWTCLCLMFFGLSPAMAHDLLADDSLVKTAFLYNFAKFTRWPLEAWSDPKSPLRLCTIGKDELVSNLKRLDQETIGARPVTVSTFAPGDAGASCHILYIAGSEHRHFTRFIQQTRDAPVLTISEIRGFADSGGIIQLYRDRQQIRFKINLSVARERGLNLSSRLLDLAELVDSGAAP
jgi:hypothetical protein